MNEETDTQIKPIAKESKESKEKTKILTVRLGQKEIDMVDALKGSPYFLNMSEFLRESIRLYYDKRVTKK